MLARESLLGVSFPPSWQVARRGESLLLGWLSPAPGCSFSTGGVDVEQHQLNLFTAELAVALVPRTPEIDSESREQLVEVLCADSDVVSESREADFAR